MLRLAADPKRWISVTAAGLPEFVEEEFDAFLDCGILARGFLRLRCADCARPKNPRSWTDGSRT